MPAAKPVQVERPVKFDDVMRRLVNMPPPPSGKKAKQKVIAPKKKKSR